MIFTAALMVLIAADALDRLMAGRTTFLIAHRHSTLENCDIRLTVDRGRVTAVDSRTASADGQAPSLNKVAQGFSR